MENDYTCGVFFHFIFQFVGLVVLYVVLRIASRTKTHYERGRTPAAQSKEYLARLDQLRKDTANFMGTSLTSRRFLVIGGTGFTGGVLVDDLVARGARSVATLSRRGPPRSPKKGVTYFKGSISDIASLEAALRNVDVVFHTAASYGWPPFTQYGKKSLTSTWNINVGGMDNVVKACQKTGVELLVFVSSCNIIFDGTDKINVDENVAYASDNEGNGFAKDVSFHHEFSIYFFFS